MSTLLEIRTQLVRTSGRYDLVQDAESYTDNGADFYIRAGQRWLDRELTLKKGVGRYIDTLQVGQYLLTFKDVRAIQEVYLARDGIGRWRLEKKDFSWMRAAFPNMDSLQNGTTYFYCPAMLEVVPPLERGYDGLMTYLGDLTGDDPSEYNGIILLPPPDASTMVEVFGTVYKPLLSVDTDTNYWSIEHPELLVMAAQLIIEMMNRNTEGVKDWRESIHMVLDGISKDLVEEEIADVEEMEGYTEDGFSRTRARRRNRGQTWYW